MLAEREQLRGEMERMTPHGMMATDEGKDKKEQSLDEKIADDPDVKEGVNLLLDMMGSSQ